jgi:hypothetical protein
MALITLKEAIVYLNEVHGIDPVKAGKDVYSVQTLYNYIHTKKLKRYGPHHMAKVDTEDLFRVLGPKQTG